MRDTIANNMANNIDLDQYVSKQVVLLKYGISERTLASWIKNRKIPYLRISSKCFRHRLADVEKALGGFRVKEVEA
jgi:predicted site-specific integrase-resolvase